MGTFRTHLIGELRSAHAGETVCLCGWVHTTREHGDLLFVLVRDRSGVAQVRVQRSDTTEHATELWTTANRLGLEFCVRIVGQVSLRPQEAINTEMETGEVEILPSEITILNQSEPLPFPIHRESEVSETLALKYR
ncbi:MAG: OB-fold nucleic acid binding domain-containing protein, partial [Candidatus Eisenbacteria bacterium]|nr:OB-fold nucleic acid binding domain-containing protein [Candidatus Eisenbacteria bacterium]